MRYRHRSCDPAAAAEFGRVLGVSATLAQVLLHRGVTELAAAKDYLAPTLAGLSSPQPMADRQRAGERLAQAVREKHHVVIFGDYDVDGTTSAAILADALTSLGARVSARIANRFAGGYGFSDIALAEVRRLEPDLVVTCDCGSSDHPRLRALREAGIDTIVVDHHLVPDEALPVLAFLNPHRPECEFAFKGLCSAGLVFLLVAAVRTELGVDFDLRPFLDLVALGTIADLAPLNDDNRRLVRAGLRRLIAEDARPGIVALREIAKIKGDTEVGATDVAFRLTPRLNAPGRLGFGQLTLDLLRAKTLGEARVMAAEVEGHNQQRRDIQQSLTEAAIEQIIAHYGEHPPHGVVAAHQDFHPGVVGIAAARLVERFGVPAVVVALQEPHDHGSARGTAGFPLHDAISSCASTLVRFGGHQAACGVTLAPAALADFRSSFAEATTRLREQVQAVQREVDLSLGIGPFGLPTAHELSMLEPVGIGNNEPLFHLPHALVEDASEVGQGHLKLRLRMGTSRLSAFGYQLAQRGIPSRGSTIQLIGHLRPDTYRGGGAIEMRIEALYPEGADIAAE